MEDDATRPEPDELEPKGTEDAAERLKQIEEEAELLRRQLREQEEAKAKAEEEAAKAEAQSEPRKPATQEELDEADRLIRQAHVAKARQEHSKALELLRQAEQLAPESVAVLVELGDGYAAKNRWKDAQTVYGRATQLEPQNVAVERKYAEAVLKANLPLEVIYGMSRGDAADQAASANMAAIISFFLPGVGQIVLGQTLKGVILLSVWLFMLFVAFLFLNNGGNTSMTQWGFIPIVIAFLLNVAAFYDAKSQAKVAKKPKMERPEPPVDLPFE